MVHFFGMPNLSNKPYCNVHPFTICKPVTVASFQHVFGEMEHPKPEAHRPRMVLGSSWTSGVPSPKLKEIPQKGGNATMNFRGVQLGSKIWGMAVLQAGN